VKSTEQLVVTGVLPGATGRGLDVVGADALALGVDDAIGAEDGSALCVFEGTGLAKHPASAMLTPTATPTVAIDRRAADR